MTEKKSMMLYFDTAEQWNMLTNEQAGELIKALLQYGKTGERINTDDGMISMAFSFMAAQIDRDGDKWEKRCERNAANGSKGGRPKKQTVFEETQKTQWVFEKPKKADTDKDTDKEKDTDTDIKINKAAKQPAARFQPPSVDEVAAYCRERKNGIDPQTFIDFYESKGWIVGKQKMKDWKAAVRNWENRRKNEEPKKGGTNISSIPSDDLDALFHSGKSSIPKSELDALFGGV